MIVLEVSSLRVFEIDGFHLDQRMLLIVLCFEGFKMIPVQHFLELKQMRRLHVDKYRRDCRGTGSARSW